MQSEFKGHAVGGLVLVAVSAGDGEGDGSLALPPQVSCRPDHAVSWCAVTTVNIKIYYAPIIKTIICDPPPRFEPLGTNL